MGRIVVHLAQEAGFCFGVRRAIDLAKEAARTRGEVATDGDLVHNQRVLESLAAEGVRSLRAGESPSCPVLIRAHGVRTRERERLSAQAPQVIDATCPMVAAIKRQVDEAHAAGDLVLVVGLPLHPEAVGLKDDRERVRLLSRAADLEEPELASLLATEPRVSLFAQSTTLHPVFEEVAQALKNLRPDADVRNTICGPTTRRQKAVEALARTMPLVLVVGDPKSANTAHLVDAASRYTRAVRVEGPQELDPSWFAGITEVGVTAGASTPDEVIAAVVQAIENMGD